jgi:hypothetical protein
MRFQISALRDSSIWKLYRMRESIQLDPEYQRLGDIWTLDKRQLLLDTVLNDFDIPKLYFHQFRDPKKIGTRLFDYAIIDGKQRLQTLWSFIAGEIALADDFEYFKDDSVKAGGMKYADLGQNYPDLKVHFDSFNLTAVSIDTDEIEMIEEMFSRLNEAVPLTAPEKRNAFGGPIPNAIRKLSDDTFFKKSIPFPNKRYRHFDIATKFLYAEHVGKVYDTKKAYLDKFVADYSGQSRTKMPAFLKVTQDNLARMTDVFTNKDPLLRQVGMVTLYYHLFRVAAEREWLDSISRKKLLDFEKRREANRKMAEKGITKAEYDLIEFDRFAQSPNDAQAIKFRLKVLFREAFGRQVATDDL